MLDIELELELVAPYIAGFPTYVDHHLYIILLHYILGLLAHIPYS